MKYFKVLPESNNVRIYQNQKYKGFLVANELKTANELKKIGLSEDSKHLQAINTNPKNTYFFFGARFQKSIG